MTEAAIVIPARWGSTRFPGKPLAMIAGRTLLERAVDLGRRSLAQRTDVRLLVATDDRRIARHAEDIGCAVVMTSATITSGSSRALAAVRALPRAPEHIINLQGDAPFMPVQAVRLVLEELIDRGADCATPVMPMSWADLDAFRRQKVDAPTSGTTCIRGPNGAALWFSKAIIPLIRDEAKRRTAGDPCPVLRHLGLYGFRRATLEQLDEMPASFYEQIEGLEQLRLIESGIEIRTVEVDGSLLSFSGIDTPADASLAELMIAKRGDPFGT